MEHLFGREQRLQVGDQKQYPRVVQGRQFVVQFRVQDLVGSSGLVQLFTPLG